jgi:hypothetical protein
MPNVVVSSNVTEYLSALLLKGGREKGNRFVGLGGEGCKKP